MSMTITHLVGSAYDERDYPYVPTATVPKSASLKRYIGGIEDQGEIGSCTANSTCSAIELICERAGKPRDLSRLFNYYNSRERDNMLGQDGATMRSAIKSAAKEGLPLESAYPYLPDIRDIRPPQAIYDDAAQSRLLRYERINVRYGASADGGFEMLHAIKSAIAEGHPVVIAMPVSSQINTLKGKNAQEMNYLGCNNMTPPAPWTYAGNHAMVVIAYDGDEIVAENSWGPQWGDNGLMYMAATTLDSDVMEAWVIKGFADIDPPPPIVYKSQPLEVIQWYHNIGRTDVNDVSDPNVQWWAQYTDDSDKFYATVIAICHKFMRVPV